MNKNAKVCRDDEDEEDKDGSSCDKEECATAGDGGGGKAAYKRTKGEADVLENVAADADDADDVGKDPPCDVVG